VLDGELKGPSQLNSWSVSPTGTADVSAACAESQDRNGPSGFGVPDGSVLCVVRGSRLRAEGCLTAPQPFAEAFVEDSECLHTSQLRCLQHDVEGGPSQVWLFSGDYFADIPAGPCDELTREQALSAPMCDPSLSCMPCDEDAGGLCSLAPPCP
jgi:hypothetical protein